MDTKEIKITVSEGYEIDRENSTFECIRFKKKKLTYDDVAKALFRLKTTFFINDRGIIRRSDQMIGCVTDANNGVTEKQLEQVLAINKLLNVAEYLNDGWKPDFRNMSDQKFRLVYDDREDKLKVVSNRRTTVGHAYFRTEELAKQAIEILGETEVKKALGVF